MQFEHRTSVRSRSASIFVVLACIAKAAAAQSADPPPTLRLPGTVAPVSYRVQLKLDPNQADFTGEVKIKLDVKQPVKTLWLNASGINVSRATLTTGGKSTDLKTASSGDDFLGLTPPAPLTPGPAEVSIEYRGKVRLQDSSGVFRMIEDGNKYLYTQFEDTDARAAFPCFDEPSYKVPWQLTLEVPDGVDAISNTPVANETHRHGDRVLEFKQTKPLPSYLVAFAVGHFDFVPAGFAGKNRAPVRIVTPKGHGNEAKYAAEVSATILTRLENYFDIPFPYEKSDQVAIPTTYGFGAMENAGMVTYAQDLILANPSRDTVTRQREYASVAAHELAHQWFGDLVTTAWWNDIWLNEAFATWMEQKLIAEWKPEWGTRVEDVNSKLGAESEDTLTSARKIRQEIKTKDDISNAFDGITYQKGAAVIGMFERWIGEAEFRKGVHSYLEKYAFRNADAPEFLAAISDATGKNVVQPFSSFLNQAGVPLLSVSLKCQGGSPVLHMEQQRSLPIDTKGAGDQTWQIPVCIRYGSGTSGRDACELMTDPRTDWKLQGSGCPAWVEANDKALGYYRVGYGGNLLSSLTEGEVQTRLGAPERVDILGDSAALSNTGKMPEGEVLGLVSKFHDDPNRYVVLRAVRIARSPDEHLVPQDLRVNYQRFVEKNFGERAHQLGWLPKPDESENDTLLRPPLLAFVATLGNDHELAAQAASLTDKWFADRNAVPANETAAVLEAAAYYGDRALFERFLTQFKKTTDHQERYRIIAAMGSFRNPAALSAGMDAVLSGEVPFIEGQGLLYAGQEFPQTRNLSFDFMKQHIDQLAKMRPTGGGKDAGSMFVRSGQDFCTEQSKQELKQFFEPQASKFTGAPRMLAQTLEQIQSCIANKSAQQSSVEDFLRGF